MTVLRHPVLWVVLVLLALTALWHAIGAPISLITQIAIYMLYGAGVNLLVGYTGLVPFGASVFFGCATYAVAIAMRGAVNNEIVALAIAVVFSLLLAAAIALLILRRRGLYFSLLTLAFSQIAFEIAFKWTDVTGGENGLQGVPRPWFASDWSFHAFTIVAVALGMGLLWRIAHAPFGRLLQALRDNEQRVRSLGYNTFRIKFEAFVIMGGVVGFAGALLAFMLRGAYADNLNWQHAGDSLLMTVMGGVHHFLGPLWGAIAFILLEDRLSAVTESWWLIFAPIVMVFALASPEGMQGLVFRLPSAASDWTLTRRGVPPRPAAYRTMAGRRRRASRCRQADAGSARPAQAIRFADRRGRRASRRASVPPAQPDRPERRRQDDVLQHADRPAARRRRRDPFRRPRHHASAGAPAHSPGAQPFVPDPQRVPQPDDVRECARRGAGAEQPAELAVARRLPACRCQRAHLVAARRGRAGRARRGTMRQPVAWRAASAGDRHRARHRRKAAAARRTAGRAGRGGSRSGGRADPPACRDARGAADRARHRPRAGAVGSHHGAAPGPCDRRRQASRGREQPGRDHGVHGHRACRRAATDRASRGRARCRDEAAARAGTGARRLCRQSGADRSRSRRARGRGGGAAWAATASARPRCCVRSPARCRRAPGAS